MQQPPGPRRAICVVLAGAAGFTDAAGFLALDLFTAHMSGNSARLGVYLGDGLLVRAAPSAFAVAVFVLAIGVGTAATEVLARAGTRSPAATVLIVEAAMLVTLAAVGSVVEVHGRIPQSPASTYYPLAALAVGAMGLQTSTLQRVSGKTVRTTYVSGMLTALADEVVTLLLGPAGEPTAPDGRSYLRDELGMQPGPAAARRVRLILGIWLAYVAGAVLGGYLERQIHLACLAAPCAVILAVVGVELLTPRPGRAGRPAGSAGRSAR